MGSGHTHVSQGHSEPTAQAIAARRKANYILAAVLVPLTLLTLAAMAMLWPSGSKDGCKWIFRSVRTEGAVLSPMKITWPLGVTLEPGATLPVIDIVMF